MKIRGPRRFRGRPRGKSRRLDLRPGEGPLDTIGDFTGTASQVWSPRANIICLLAASGMKNVEIAEVLRISPQSVSNTINDPRAKDVIIQAQQHASENVLDLNQRLKETAAEAYEAVVEVMRNSEDERLRAKVGFGLLDRAGYTPIQRHVVKAAPTLPEGLVERVTETHAELKQITKEYRYTAPSPPAGQDVSNLPATGIEG